jgi:DNA-binding NtrC family response regulator
MVAAPRPNQRHGTAMATILIVDDDPTQRRLMQAALERQGFDAVQADGGEAALALLTNGADIDAVLLDLVMPGMDGMTALGEIGSRRPELPVIVLTAQSGIDIIVQVMRAGAADFVPKPASPERLRVSIDNALRVRALSGEVSRLTRRAEGNMGFGDLVGSSPAMQAAVDMARRGAASTIPVLIEGESGVGKEMFARAIQGAGERAGRPFIAVNCGAIPDNLVESVLFGHEKGAFTGATEKHVGKFQEADGGTLFLDEVGELRADIQVKLLRAIQEGEVDPIGARRPVKVDVRLISATNRDLQAMIAEGSFREDLYYRLSVFPIAVPPLRERPDDILPLAEHFVRMFAATEGKRVAGIDAAARTLIAGYRWPGNVRQLENAIFRAVVLSDGDLLCPADFPQLTGTPAGAAAPAAGPADTAATAPPVAQPAPASGDGLLDGHGDIRALADVEAEMIRRAVELYGGRMSEVARRLGIGRSTLYRKLDVLGLGGNRQP